MSLLDDVAERDGWRCWVCDEPVDPEMSVNDPRGPSVDSRTADRKAKVVERLAHRGCNTRKGAVKVVIAWPDRLYVVEPAPLITVAARLERKGGREMVGRCPTRQDAQEAADWLVDRFSRLVPGLPVTADIEAGRRPVPRRPGHRPPLTGDRQHTRVALLGALAGTAPDVEGRAEADKRVTSAGAESTSRTRRGQGASTWSTSHCRGEHPCRFWARTVNGGSPPLPRRAPGVRAQARVPLQVTSAGAGEHGHVGVAVAGDLPLSAPAEVTRRCRGRSARSAVALRVSRSVPRYDYLSDPIACSTPRERQSSDLEPVTGERM